MALRLNRYHSLFGYAAVTQRKEALALVLVELGAGLDVETELSGSGRFVDVLPARTLRPDGRPVQTFCGDMLAVADAETAIGLRRDARGSLGHIPKSIRLLQQTKCAPGGDGNC